MSGNEELRSIIEQINTVKYLLLPLREECETAERRRSGANARLQVSELPVIWRREELVRVIAGD